MAESEHFTKEQLLEQCKNAKPIPGRNSMGMTTDSIISTNNYQL